MLIVKDLALVFFWGPFRLVVKMFPVKIAFFLAKIIACVFFIFFRRDLVEIVQENFKPEDKNHALKIAARSFELYVKRNVENLFMSNLTKDYLDDKVTIVNIEYLKSALENKKGVIIALSHFGSFMTILPALGFKGFPVNQVAGKADLSRPVLKWMYETKIRENAGLPVKFLHVGRSARPVIRALKNNELVAVAFDGRDGKNWVTVPWLGRRANISPGSVRLADLTGSVILPTFIIRQPGDTHRLILEKPFVLQPDRDKNRFVLKNMKRLANIFDCYIQKYPCHFAMTIRAIQKKEDKNMKLIPLFKRDDSLVC